MMLPAVSQEADSGRRSCGNKFARRVCPVGAQQGQQSESARCRQDRPVLRDKFLRVTLRAYLPCSRRKMRFRRDAPRMARPLCLAPAVYATSCSSSVPASAAAGKRRSEEARTGTNGESGYVRRDAFSANPYVPAHPAIFFDSQKDLRRNIPSSEKHSTSRLVSDRAVATTRSTRWIRRRRLSGASRSQRKGDAARSAF
jgi:hypothetical protein